MFGAPATYSGPDKWEVAVSWRNQRSDRHFVGHEEQRNRITEHSQVINRINQLDVSITRKYTKGWRFTVSIPYLMAERSSPIRDPNTNEVIDRSDTTARGMGDIVLMGRKWLWDPAAPHKGNVSLGFGGKLPTGQNNVVDTRTAVGATGLTNTERTVDQSIQPGDGGFGVVLDVLAFRRFANDRFATYGSGTYLINPQTDSGVRTYRNGAGEEIMSIADQYLVRGGVAWYPGGGWGTSLGLRLEGVPVFDIVGSSDGFRRPGYALSAEPAVSYTRGPHTFSLQIPIAIDRTRQRSVPDRENGGAGDAAFADFFLLGGYIRRF